MSTDTSYHGISVLPNEILLRIFDAVVREETESSSFAQTLAPAWVLSVPHVCSRWRTLALGTGKLWTRVSPSFAAFWYDESVKRAQDAFLHPVISLVNEEEILDDESMADLAWSSGAMDTILRPGRSEEEEEEEEDGDPYFVYRLGDDAPNLHTLNITQPTSGVQLNLPFLFYENHAALRTLSISCPCLQLTQWTTGLFKDLTSLTMHTIMTHGILRVLCRVATKLERLTYTAPHPQQTDFHVNVPFVRDEDPLVMESLRELTIQSFSQPDSENFLGNLELPVLERLYLRFRVSNSWDANGRSQTIADLAPLLRPLAHPRHAEFLVHKGGEVAFVLGASPVSMPNVILVLETIKSKTDTLAFFPRLFPLVALDGVRTLGLTDASSPEEFFKVYTWRKLLEPFTGVEELWCMQPTHQEVHNFELLNALWPQAWEPYVLAPEKLDDGQLLPALRKINLTRRPTRFAGLREPEAITVFEEWSAAPDGVHPYELLRLADRVGRLNLAKRAAAFVFEDIEGMEENICEMLGRGGERDVRMAGSRIVVSPKSKVMA